MYEIVTAGQVNLPQEFAEAELGQESSGAGAALFATFLTAALAFGTGITLAWLLGRRARG